MLEYVLQTTGLTKKYRKQCVLDHISLKVQEGDIYGLIGIPLFFEEGYEVILG